MDVWALEDAYEKVKNLDNRLFLSGPDLVDVLFSMALSTIVGLLISQLYRGTHRGLNYEHTFMASLVMLAPIVTLVMLFIRGDLVLSLGLIHELEEFFEFRHRADGLGQAFDCDLEQALAVPFLRAVLLLDPQESGDGEQRVEHRCDDQRQPDIKWIAGVELDERQDDQQADDAAHRPDRPAVAGRQF